MIKRVGFEPTKAANKINGLQAISDLQSPELPQVPLFASRFALAVSLYSQDILGLGKAARLADLPRSEMNRVLAQRQIPMHYGPEELAEDLHHGRGDH